MLNQTSIQKLKRGAMAAVMSIAILLPFTFSPMATHAKEKKTVVVTVTCCRPLHIDIKIEPKKDAKTETKSIAVPSSEPSLAGSGTAAITGGQLVIALTKMDVQHSNTVSLDQETELNQNTARALGYQGVTLLPGEYALQRDQTVRINVRTETALAEDSSAGKFEVGAQFASLNVGHSSRTEPGIGTRLTYDVLPNIALEGEVNYFPQQGQSANSLGSGRITEGLFGVKAGKRFRTIGVFGKVRPGVVSFGKTILGRRFENGRLVTISGRTTHSALDLGGVVEFYPSSWIVTRFDIGDTIIRYPCPTPTDPSPTDGVVFGNPCPLGPLSAVVSPPKQYLTEHNFQFNSSVGFRF